MRSDNSRAQQSRRLSIRGVMAYVALWAVFLGVVRVLTVYSSIGATGPYLNQAGLITDFGLPIAIGLFCSAIGIAIAFLSGRLDQYRAIAIWSFMGGCLAIPIVWVAVIVLASIGLLTL